MHTFCGLQSGNLERDFSRWGGVAERRATKGLWAKGTGVKGGLEYLGELSCLHQPVLAPGIHHLLLWLASWGRQRRVAFLVDNQHPPLPKAEES